MKGKSITLKAKPAISDAGKNSRTDKTRAHFKTMQQINVPQGRKGKHQLIVATILSDLLRLQEGSAIKVPLADLLESKDEGTFGPESRHAKSRAKCCHCQRRHLPLYLEHQRIRYGSAPVSLTFSTCISCPPPSPALE